MTERKAIHRLLQPERFEAHKWIYREQIRDVRVLAIAGKWAMVRRPRCTPYVAPLTEIEFAAEAK